MVMENQLSAAAQEEVNHVLDSVLAVEVA